MFSFIAMFMVTILNIVRALFTVDSFTLSIVDSNSIYIEYFAYSKLFLTFTIFFRWSAVLQ